jgi:Ser/Thr protein kinase RdoA (MazF antagonist)
VVPLEALIPHLVAQGVLSARAVVGGGVLIREVSSRNFDAVIEVSSEPSLFVKQASGKIGRRLLAAEAAWYEQLSSHLGETIPRLLYWDAANALLVLEMVPGADMRTAADSTCRDPAVAMAVGQALGRLHTAHLPLAESAHTIPGVLFLHEPGPELLRDGSAAAIELVRLLQQEDQLADALSELRSELRAVSVIHHDLKWDNVVVEQLGEAAVAHLVDWETAGVGDAAWDVGTFLSGYVSSWIFSLPSFGETAAERMTELASRPLAQMRTPMAAFWREYLLATRTRDWSRDDGFLSRTIRCAAARLLQTALEASQLSDQLTPPVILHLQVSQNLFSKPLGAAVSLLGIQPIAIGGQDAP